jgi:rhodanese-related sulfurtransferase
MLNIKNAFSTLLIVLALLTLSTATSANIITELNHKAFMDVAGQSLVVDVRTPEEFAEGHVPGAVNIPLATVGDNLAAFGANDNSIVVYCRSGYRAGKALEVLSNAGYTNLYHLEGDIQGWKEAGQEMEVPAAP